MGIDATQKIRMFFVNKDKDSNENKELAMKTFKEIKENKIFGKEVLNLTLSLEGKFPIVELLCDSRNYWLERWGLRAIQENVDDWDIINGWGRDYWHKAGDFCIHFNCILEIETWVSPIEGCGNRRIVGHDGDCWFFEVEHVPFYGKTTVEQLFEGYEKYERYINTQMGYM